MYVLAVDPAQACSFSTTFPQSLPDEALLLSLLDESSFFSPQAATDSASTSAITTAQMRLPRNLGCVIKLPLLLVALVVSSCPSRTAGLRSNAR